MDKSPTLSAYFDDSSSTRREMNNAKMYETCECGASMDSMDRDDSMFHHSEINGEGISPPALQISPVATLGLNPLFSRLNNELSERVEIGEGTFGIVEKVRLDIDGQWYALKQSKKEIAGESELQQRAQEIYALSVCNHPNILRYFDGLVDEKKVCIRTELLVDGSINRIARPWSAELIQSFTHQMASALHWLHSHNIAHGDVKPDNIFFLKKKDGSLFFKLGDFGLARPLVDVSADSGESFKGINDNEGDDRYLCFADRSNYNGSPLGNGSEADVYALGASVVELMGGVPEKAREGLYGDYFGTYPSQLRALVVEMTNSMPMNRPSAFDVLLRTRSRVCENTDLLKSQLNLVKELQEEQSRLKAELEAANNAYDECIEYDDDRGECA